MSMLKNKHFNKLKKMNNIIMQMKLQPKIEEGRREEKYICCRFNDKCFIVPFFTRKKRIFVLVFYVTTIFVLLFFLFAFRSFIHS